MKIIISPAKKMRIENETALSYTSPLLMEYTNQLYHQLLDMNYEELKKLWACNDQIAGINYERLRQSNPGNALSPALLSYEGLQYQYMAPQVFTDRQWDYVTRNLFILSGLYGILRPSDRIIPYRLEMQAKLGVDKYKDLYAFWGEKILNEIKKQDSVILNLASKEYSKAVEKYLSPGIRYITCIFGELQDGKWKVKATQAKMARGEMVRWLSQENIDNPEEVKHFQELGYRYMDGESDQNTLVFCKEPV